jgi:hypothetical protein
MPPADAKGPSRIHQAAKIKATPTTVPPWFFEFESAESDVAFDLKVVRS